MQTLESVKEIVKNIKFKDWDICVRPLVNTKDRCFIQVQFDAPCSNSGQIERQYCRKWLVSYPMTETEIVRMVHKAIEAAVLHEMNESFYYMGERIMSPHVDLVQMVKFCKENERDERL